MLETIQREDKTTKPIPMDMSVCVYVALLTLVSSLDPETRQRFNSSIDMLVESDFYTSLQRSNIDVEAVQNVLSSLKNLPYHR